MLLVSAQPHVTHYTFLKAAEFFSGVKISSNPVVSRHTPTNFNEISRWRFGDCRDIQLI